MTYEEYMAIQINISQSFRECANKGYEIYKAFDVVKGNLGELCKKKFLRKEGEAE